ncbi:MAG: T9SS type A sorting domain-containing protein [Sphingobacteriales bacterium]|nr:MAG: T9SS type A sorting domain-containing protein [Sphingobacteriales bacterium]
MKLATLTAIYRFFILIYLITFSPFIVLSQQTDESDEPPVSCFVDLGDIVFPGNQFCANEPLPIPCVDFNTTEAGPAAGLMWAVYSCQPTSADPFSDPCSATFNVLLSNPEGNPIFGCGQSAIFANTNILTPGVPVVCVYLVPIINNDTTTNLPGTCTGIVPGFSYPMICFLNPEENPEICDSECEGLTEENDECEGAISLTLSPGIYGNFSNVCSTAFDDPSGVPSSCFDSDPYQASVWFTLTGNGGTYSLFTRNCEGSAETQLSDSQISIYTGTCGGPYSLLVCNDDIGPNTLAGITNFATTIGETYLVLIDGYENSRGEFCIEVVEVVAPPLCEADFGEVSPSSSSVICESEGLTFTASGANTTGYVSFFAVVNTTSGNIVLSNSGTTLTISGSALGAGTYTVHALNIGSEDLSSITPFPANIAQLNSILGTPGLCSDFDATGISLTVLPTPNISASGNSPLCEGETINLFGNTTSPGTASFSWQGPGGYFSAEQNPVIVNATTSNTGTYILTITIAGCQSTPASTSVTVNPIPTVIASNNSPVCQGPEIQLSAVTSATGTVTFNWEGPNAFTSTLQDPEVSSGSFENSGIYTVTVTANGCVSEPSSTEVIINPLPTVEVSVSNSNPCQGTCFTLNAVSSLPDAVYNWTGPVGFESNEPNLEFCDVQPDITGEYCVFVVVNGCASELLNCVSISVLPPDDPACAELCLANSGIVLTDDPNVCPDELLITQIIGATSGIYQTYWLLTDDVGNVLEVQTNGDFIISVSGSYFVYSLNFLTEDSALVNTLLDSGVEISDIQNAITSLEFCAALSAGLPVLILGETSVGCFNCLADGGTVTYSGEINVCENGITEPFTFTANNTTPGYLTYLIITDAVTTQIMAFTGESSINWTALGLPDGSYTVFAINFAVEFVSGIETALNSGLLLDDFLSSAGDTGFCFDVSEGTTQFIVIPFDVSPCSETCFANFGTITPPFDSEICPDETATPAIISGAATSGYTTVFLVTTIVSGSVLIVDLSNNTEITCPGDGDYQIHALNYANIDAVLVQSAIVIGDEISSMLFNLSVADVCYDFDINGYSLTCLPENAIACLDPLAVINLTETPAGDGLTYTVSFTVTGGSGNYIIDGFPSDADFISDPIPCGISYNFEITDDVASGILVVSGVSPCVCATSAGTMPNLLSAAPVCWGGSVTLTTINPVLIPGDTLIYILHNGSTTNLGDFLAISSDGNFGMDNALPGVTLLTNTTYYISPVAGPTDPEGNLIFNDPCTKVGEGAPIVFLEPISYLINESCDWMTGDYTTVLFLSGGLPEYDNSQPYFITGDIQMEAFFGQSVTNIFLNGTTTIYEYEITDGVCTDVVTASEAFVCIKTPIVLLEFKGEVQQRGNLLKWTTATETDNDYFSLERSENGTNFTRIALVEGAGTSITANKYEYLDKEPPAGTSYYRLVQVDFNGTSSTSETISLKRKEAVFGFNAIYPIPADKFVEISFTSESDTPVSIEVYDLAGKLAISLDIFAQKGTNVYSINISELSSGMYFISLNNGNKVISNRFVKK